MTEHTTVGIDIAKDTFDVFISPDGQFLHLENTPYGHQQLLDVLASRTVVRIVMEATGRYHSLLTAT
ncbi:IS110 family transposase, partial [Enterobacter cloacae]